MLPRIPYRDNIRRRGQDDFRGINRNPFAGDGVIYDCRNMSARYYPAASTRPYRWTIDLSGKFVDGYSASRNYVYEGNVYTVAYDISNSEHKAKLYVTDITADDPIPTEIGEFPEWLYTDVSFTVMNNYLIIFPMGAVYNMVTGEMRYIDQVFNAPSGTLRYSDGTYKGIDAARNTVTSSGDAFPFNVGDCVCFEGSRFNDGLVAVVQEISDDGMEMRFYENTFTWSGDSAGWPEDQAITISRKIPEGLEHVMCVNNRLWACGGKKIAASADGDPFNWNTFEGTDADSWQTDVLGEGDFTSCINYGGIPHFFKPGALVKVLGDYPSTFRTSETVCRGVKSDAGKTLAEVGGYLFWLSDIGMMYCSGGIPRPIGAELGKIEFKEGCAGSDGRRYYISLNNGSAGSAEFYSYDTEYGFWYREDNLYVSSFSGTDILYASDNYGKITVIGDPPVHLIPPSAAKEENFRSSVIFTDFFWDTGDKKVPVYLNMRLRIHEGGSVMAYIRYDSEEDFKEIAGGTIIGDGRTVSRYLPLQAHRCDHFTLKIEGVGEWQLAYLAVESAVGSSK